MMPVPNLKRLFGSRGMAVYIIYAKIFGIQPTGLRSD
jgi:hypothetical protein